MIRHLYYLTLANNGSVLTRLIDSAEEEEYKETILSYFFLWQAHNPHLGVRAESLDVRIEAFLKVLTGYEINFEVDDALAKLDRLGLVARDRDGSLQAVPIVEALARLDRHWAGSRLADRHK